jgi:hypothetical protein
LSVVGLTVSTLDAILRRIVTDLALTGHECALIGGLAVSVRTEPRFTRDADLAVAVADDADAEALVMALRDRGYHDAAVLEQDATARLATVRLSRPEEPDVPVIDLLFASSGIEPEIVAESETMTVIAGLRMRVATAGHLIALKVLARDDVRRPQDIIDLRALVRTASADELARAKRALALIRSRGYHRGRDLLRDFDTITAGK